MQKTFRTFLVFTFFAVWTVAFPPAAAAQAFGLGAKVGVTLTDAVSSVESQSIPDSATFIVGPYVEIGLGSGFSIEGDALYYPGLYPNAAGGGSAWQFPILAKLKFLNGPVRPYIEGGPSYSHISDVKTLPDLLHTSNYGITLGAGIQFKFGVLRLSPEIRYNGFLFTNLNSPLGFFKSDRSQAVLLVGIGF